MRVERSEIEKTLIVPPVVIKAHRLVGFFIPF
jgi:hypothetical protein